MPHKLGRLRTLSLLAAVALALIMALPPVGGYGRQHAVAQAFQFVVFAAVTPALLVLGWPSRLSRASRVPSWLTRRPATRISAALLPYFALVVVWRVPVVLAAVVRDPALTALELVTLVAAGCALWAELAGPRAARNPLPGLQRATIAAVAMWSIWAIAYITGMSTTGLAGAQAAVPDHQLAVGVMWAVSGLCYVPVVFAAMMTWFGGHDGHGKEIAGLLADPAWPDAASPLPPPRGWR